MTNTEHRQARKLLKDYDVSPRAINEDLWGGCGEFAGKLANVLDPGATVYMTNAHAFVERGGLFYDAEALGGVSDWRRLPYFERHGIGSVEPYVLE